MNIRTKYTEYMVMMSECLIIQLSKQLLYLGENNDRNIIPVRNTDWKS